jgi:hypothetical protein
MGFRTVGKACKDAKARFIVPSLASWVRIIKSVWGTEAAPGSDG